MAYQLGVADSVTDVVKTLRNTILKSFENCDELPWPTTAEYLQNQRGILPGELKSYLKIVLFGKEKSNC